VVSQIRVDLEQLIYISANHSSILVVKQISPPRVVKAKLIVFEFAEDGWFEAQLELSGAVDEMRTTPASRRNVRFHACIHTSSTRPCMHPTHPYLSGICLSVYLSLSLSVHVCVCVCVHVCVRACVSVREFCALSQGCSLSPLPGHNVPELAVEEPRPPRVKRHVGVEEHFKTAPTPESIRL